MKMKNCNCRSSAIRGPSVWRHSPRITTFHFLVVLQFLCLINLPSTLALKKQDYEDTWYQRYPFYPKYCSTPAEMATRSIPPLNLTGKGMVHVVRHVTAIMRHGARTPYSNTLQCWDDYWTSPQTAVWNCNLTAFLSPPPPEVVTEEGAHAGNDEAMFLFDKKYNALDLPAQGIGNELNGTCQKGQLLLQGYRQEFWNGQMLRRTYIQPQDKDLTMDILAMEEKEQRGNLWDYVYYRVDDEPRTLMSGQVILRGMLGPEMDAFFGNHSRYPVIPLHTADYDRDILVPNEKICPRLTEMRQDLYETYAYKHEFDQSDEAKLLRKFQQEVLKTPRVNYGPNSSPDMDAIDCLMTTICTDRPLHEAVNDFHDANASATDNPFAESIYDLDYGRHRFQRLVDFETQKYTRNLLANDGQYAKLAMAPMWSEIRHQIETHLKSPAEDRYKFALFSGHDTTIMPLLAALDPNLWPVNEWPPYASLVALEIHAVHKESDAAKEAFPGAHAFRLIYNGQVITQKVTGCPQDYEICPIEVLWAKLDEFVSIENRKDQCERDFPAPSDEFVNPVERTEKIASTTDGAIYLVVLSLCSAFVGAVIACVLMNTNTFHLYSNPSGLSPMNRRNRASNIIMTDDDFSMRTYEDEIAVVQRGETEDSSGLI